MRIRCDIHLNGGHRRLLLVSQQEETLEHLALKLAGFILFWDSDPTVEVSLKNPALAGQEFRPDLVAFNDAGDIALWVECGNVTMHKLNKLSRRYSQARVVVLKEQSSEAQRLRKEVAGQLTHHHRVEILGWPPGEFGRWRDALREDTHVMGEATGHSLNLVLNEIPFAVDLQIF
ncbi:MAG TPA: YaeQ family protein [Elusimicrobiota bacterium]|nr:YaeQ family protein [Elusimicrobiota bacterium]